MQCRPLRARCCCNFSLLAFGFLELLCRVCCCTCHRLETEVRKRAWPLLVCVFNDHVLQVILALVRKTTKISIRPMREVPRGTRYIKYKVVDTKCCSHRWLLATTVFM